MNEDLKLLCYGLMWLEEILVTWFVLSIFIIDLLSFLSDVMIVCLTLLIQTLGCSKTVLSSFLLWFCAFLLGYIYSLFWSCLILNEMDWGCLITWWICIFVIIKIDVDPSFMYLCAIWSLCCWVIQSYLHVLDHCIWGSVAWVTWIGGE